MRLGEGQFQSGNDTLDYLCQRISEEKWRLVDIGRIVVSCAEVKAELTRLESVQELGVGKNKGLIVPKSMFIGSVQTNFDRLALLTCYEAERYQVATVARLLGCSSATHEGVDIERILGRRNGECSVLLDSQSLSRFDNIVFSQRLDKDLRRRNAVVAYCLSEGYYFCVSSFEFMEQYADKFMKGKVTKSQEVFK